MGDAAACHGRLVARQTPVVPGHMPDTANDIEQTRQQIYDAVEAMPEEAVRRLWRVLYDWLRLHPLSCVLLVSLGVEGAFF